MHLGSRISRPAACGLAAAMVWLAGAAPAASKTPAEARKTAKSQKENGEDGERVEAGPGGKDPTAFTAALEQGKAALDQMEGCEAGIRMSEDPKDPALAKLRKEKADYEASAFRLFNLALALADKAPPKERADIKEVNAARYFLCFLHYGRGEYYDSAVMGEFLARHCPEALEGRQGARIALASYLQLFGESKEPDKDKVFEVSHIEQIAQYIIKQWPGEEEAQDAALRLLNLAIQQRQMDQALGYLKQIPEASPLRVNAELRIGQALWATYLMASQTPPEQRPSADQLQRFKVEAEKALCAAVERTRKEGQVSPIIAGAMLSLAQIYLEMNDNDKAIATLEDKDFGPLKLVKAKDPASGREGFAVETYKVALRGFVATGDLKNATKVMNSLEKRIGNSGNAKAGENLTAIYIMLGHELQQHLERLQKTGQHKEFDAAAAAFENFLKRILERGGGNSFSSLSWVAENFYALATRQDDGAAEPSEKVKGYYESATKGYEQILARVEKDPAFAPKPDSLIGIRLRMAISERRIGNYKTAIKLVAAVLQERPKMITAQIEGAETYQLSGAVDKRGYLDAIAGGERTPKGNNVIWGWGKLAKTTQDDERFEETFFQSRLKIAECRYLFALKATDKADRDKYLEMAKKELRLMYRTYPKLGGAESYAKYDRLTKQVQGELGEKPIGVQEFIDADAQSAQLEK